MILCNPLDLYPLDTVVEREKLTIFGVCVPQKQAAIVWEKVQKLWKGHRCRPFYALAKLHRWGVLRQRLEELRIGQYTRVYRALAILSSLPDCWKWSDIECVIGRKTARMVGLYSVPSARVAALDVIVLSNLQVIFPKENVPRSTPTNDKEYARIEKLFLEQADRYQMEPWELDKMWWARARFRKKET